MDNRNPHREFGLVSPEVAGRVSGVEFLQRLLDATYPAPPFSEVAEVWPIAVEVGRVAFEASPSARFYNPMGLVHGGWLALLLDSAMGCAVHSTLEPGQAWSCREGGGNWRRGFGSMVVGIRRRGQGRWVSARGFASRRRGAW